jgi:hypothetical protein
MYNNFSMKGGKRNTILTSAIDSNKSDNPNVRLENRNASRQITRIPVTMQSVMTMPISTAAFVGPVKYLTMAVVSSWRSESGEVEIRKLEPVFG